MKLRFQYRKDSVGVWLWHRWAKDDIFKNIRYPNDPVSYFNRWVTPIVKTGRLPTGNLL